jgi:hypothetical protein
MTDISDAGDLIATARAALLSELLPALPEERRYAGLMIANAMAIAEREHRLGSETAESEAARLRDLLATAGLPAVARSGVSTLPDVAALRRAIAAAIRAGRFDTPASAASLAADLQRTAAEWVAISNPKALRP